jgi:hypothetical protein
MAKLWQSLREILRAKSELIGQIELLSPNFRAGVAMTLYHTSHRKIRLEFVYDHISLVLYLRTLHK